MPHFLAGLKVASPGAKYKLLVDKITNGEPVLSSPYFGRFVHLLFGSSTVGLWSILMQPTSMKKYKGKLMIAIATDANNKIYLLAFAVVKSESTETYG